MSKLVEVRLDPASLDAIRKSPPVAAKVYAAGRKLAAECNQYAPEVLYAHTEYVGRRRARSHVNAFSGPNPWYGKNYEAKHRRLLQVAAANGLKLTGGA